ncbi:MAG TPA: metal-dependent hydrolase, partial [Thermoanaerobaculia bacterium]|nr:metal-dependent hydrolase [Thermoanaerobaculia bacterium]
LASLLLTACVRFEFRTFTFIFLCAISHPLLDAMTNGGRGIAFFAPFSNHRYFFPWRPIRASPIGAEGFFTDRGIATVMSELMWVWLPFAVAWVMGMISARRRSA